MQWSPHLSGTAVRLFLAVTLGALAVLGVDDAPGRLLLGTASAASLLVALHDLVARPRLSAGPEGVVVRTWAGRRELSWRDLRIRRRTTSRFGFPRQTLELDDDPGPDEAGTLVVLGRRDVGKPLDEVVRALEALDPRR